jgi:hypothetical protein
MVRKTLIVIALCGVASHGSGGATEPVTGAFEATPCAALCANHAAGADACRAPSPEGSWDEIVVTATGTLLTVEVAPRVDWDSFICTKPESGTNGEVLVVGANLIGDECDNTLGSSNLVPIGCDEVLQIGTEPGTRYVVRAYNVADPFPAPYTIWGAEA